MGGKKFLITLVPALLIIIPAAYIGLEERNNPVITAEGYVRMLGVGINVDWMNFEKINRYYFYWRSKGVNIPTYFKEKGFNNVRIRVKADIIHNETALMQLNKIVNDCLKAGVIPIISYTAPELRQKPTNLSAQRQFVEWWTTLAEHFKNTSHLLAYDLVIETSGPIEEHPEVLNKVYKEVIQRVREVDPHRIIIVTPAGISKPEYLRYLTVKNDGYIIAEWHIYAGGPKKCRYNSTYIRNSIEIAINWSAKTGIPTWLGAWRPQYYPKRKGEGCPISLVLNFSKTMVMYLNRAGIPYDINSDVHFFDIAHLRWYPQEEDVLNVILHSSSV